MPTRQVISRPGGASTLPLTPFPKMTISLMRPVIIFVGAIVLSARPAMAAEPTALHPGIRAVLDTHCIKCHGEEKKKGKVALHEIDADFENGDTMALWERVLEQLQTGEMPPEEKPQPSAAEREEIVVWIQDQLIAVGKGFEVQSRLLLPDYGNRVSHELLFNGEIDELPYTPARLWRMSPHVFRGKRYQDIVQGGLEAEPITFQSKANGIRDYASQEVMGESDFLSLKMTMEDIISDQMHDRQLAPTSWGPDAGKLVTVPGKESFKAISEAKGPPTREAMERVIREEFERATGRPIAEEEMTRHLAFMEANIKRAGNETGLGVSLLGIYLSTEAVYRLELGRGPEDEHGRRMLAPQEVALALSYAFTDSPTADVPIIREALAAGQLSSREDIELVVRKMVAAGSPPIRKNFPAAFFSRLVQEGEHGFGYYPRVVRFFEEFFQYPKAEGVFKDSPGGGIGGRALVGAPQGHIAAILNEDHNVIEELLSSPRFNNNREQMIALLTKRHEQKLRTLPPEKHAEENAAFEEHRKSAEKLPDVTFRAGILTDPSWLITFSTNDANDPVHRGIWIREKLLAGSVPDLPLGVDAKIPEDHDKTLRERFEVTQAEACWKCHRTFNPLGMPFESFTDRGWIRTGMYYNKKNEHFETQLNPAQIKAGLESGDLEERVFDTSGEISGTGEKDIDGPVKDASEFVHRLAKSERVRQSIIRHAFRFWMGRNEMLSDSKTLIAADQAYLASGGKFSEILVSFLTSDSFLYRK